MLHVVFCRKSRVYQIFCSLLVFLATQMMIKSSLGQSQRIDSLKGALSTGADSTLYETSIALIRSLVDVDNDQALDLATKVIRDAYKSGDSAHIVTSSRLKGQILRRMDQLEESIKNLAIVLPIAKRNGFEEEVKLLLNSLAIAYTFNANYDKALEYHFQSLLLREKDGDQRAVSVTLQNIGVVYFRLSNSDLALNYFMKSLKVKEETNYDFDLDHLLVNIGLCYNKLRDYLKAEEYFNRALMTCGADCDNQIVIEAELGLGESFANQRNYDEAEKHTKKSLELSVGDKLERWEFVGFVALGQIKLKKGDLSEVEKYLLQAKAVSKNLQDTDLLSNFYKLGADFYTQSQNFEQANVFQRKYSDLRDSIFNADVIKNLAHVQAQYAERENLAIIKNKDEVLLLNQEVIDQQRVTNWLLIAVVLITSTLGFIIYRNYKNIKVVNLALDSAKKTIEEQNHLLDRQVQEKTKELLNTNESLSKVNDELDNFIYKTSHDIRGPLASLKGMVNLARMDVKDEKALGYLGKLDLTAEKLNVILTRLLIVNRINHAELKPESVHFEPMLQEILLLEVKKGIPAKVNIEYNVDPAVILHSDREMVRLILENLIDNSIKFHNESPRVDSFVKVLVKQDHGNVVVHVLDNGVGISQLSKENIFHMFVRASERSETGGIGLYLAKIATEKLGGEISLLPTEDVTEFQVKFPNDLQRIIDKRREEKRRQEQERMWLEENQGTVQSA